MVLAGALAWLLVLLPAASGAWPVDDVDAPPVAASRADAPGQSGTQSGQAGTPVGPIRLPTVTVTARKTTEDVQTLPESVTAVRSETLEEAAIRTVGEAAQYAPNTFFSEFAARKLSFPRFRGISSASPNNPAVTTYIDGVPQLNTNSSSQDLIDVEQIEFVRGPQSALFGRNTLGGLVNITSTRPSLQRWQTRASAPFGNYAATDLRVSASGPLADRLAVGVGLGYSRRDGFTIDKNTRNDVDTRSAFSAKGQVLWTPADNWEARAILSGERARDGDYALNDLDAVRSVPYLVSRDLEGFTWRTIVAPTVLLTRTGRAIDLFTTTGFVHWKTEDLTDLDYSPFPLITRNNDEKDFQFTQEVRLASARDASLRLSPSTTLTWQAGAVFFTQSYEQDAVNTFSPYVLSEFVPFPVDSHSPQAALDDRGIGVYGQGTLTFAANTDVTFGLRGDYERKEADVRTFVDPLIFPSTSLVADRTFGDLSPAVTVAHRVAAGKMAYAVASRGFKAGGFNAASPAGQEAFGEEHSWNYEGGFKSSWLSDRLTLNAAVFHIRWSDLQVAVPNPRVPAQFYTANAAGATSTGVEVELQARPGAGLDVFAGAGVTNAEFSSGSLSSGVPVGGNRLPSTPDYTANAGLHYARQVTGRASVYGRAEVVAYGGYHYDDFNTVGQDAYALANFRGGVRFGRVFVEAWTRNAFDTRYIPVAFAFPGLAPSGFLAEPGAPRTFFVQAGVGF
jgi:iron complex outermembrane receptor protein